MAPTGTDQRRSNARWPASVAATTLSVLGVLSAWSPAWARTAPTYRSPGYKGISRAPATLPQQPRKPIQIGSGATPRLAYGPAGVFLLTRTSNGATRTYSVRSVYPGSPGRPSTVISDAGLSLGDLYENAAGKLYATFRRDTSAWVFATGRRSLTIRIPRSVHATITVSARDRLGRDGPAARTGI